MLTYFVPLIVYILSYPVMLISLFRVEIGILFFITVIPLISVMKKIIMEYPNGNNFADFLLIAIVIGWVIPAIKNNKKIFIRSPINIAVILMVVGSFINLITGYTFMSFPDDVNLERLMTWKNYMILPLLYFISINNVDTEKKVLRIIICMLLTLVAMDFNFYSTFRWFSAEHYLDSIRITGVFSNLGPNELGVFSGMYTFLLLGIAYFIENKMLRYGTLFVCACNFYPIIYSYSRAAYMCTLAGILTLGILKDRRLLVLLIILIFVYRLLLPNSVVERIDMTFLDTNEISEKELERSGVDLGGTTVDVTGRKLGWNAAMEYFNEHPFLGIGFDTFRHRFGWITHSLYYKILAEQGLLGVLINIIFYGVLLQQSYKLFRNSQTNFSKGIGLGFLSSIIVHLTGSISGDQTLYYNLMAFFWFFMGIVARFNAELVEPENKDYPLVS